MHADYDDALAGDLLESFRAGRSSGWYCRQVLDALVIRWIGSFYRHRAVPIFAMSEPAASTLFGVPRKCYDHLAGPLPSSSVVPTEPDDNASEDGRRGVDEYTWEIIRCECANVQEARQPSTALEGVGIEGWVEALHSYAIGAGSPRVLVPADKLEEARGGRTAYSSGHN